MNQNNPDKTDETVQQQADGVSRRDFLKSGIAAGVAGGVGLGATYFGYGAFVSEPVRIGIIGSGDESGVLIGALNPDYVQVVAIADIRPYNIHRTFHGDESTPSALMHRPGLMRKYGWSSEQVARKHVKVYDDLYDDLLNDSNVEGVIIALPLHLHAQATIKAMQKGKHVLCEKLMAHSVHEAKEMARVARQLNKLLSIGHQRHYSLQYANAVEAIKRGVIGDVHHIRAQWHRGNLPGRDSWRNALPNEKGSARQAPAEGITLRGKKYAGFELVPPDVVAKLRPKDKAMLEPCMGEELDELAREADELLDRLAKKEGFDLKLSGSRDKKAKRARLLQAKMMDKAVAKLLAEDKNGKKYGYIGGVVKDHKGKAVYKYSPLEELIRWRLFDRTGGGLMVELGAHQIDASSIFISALRPDGKNVQPLSVTAVGGRHIFPANRDVDDHVYSIFEFPGPDYYEDFDRKIVKDENKKIGVAYSSINGNGFGGYGELVMGTKGTVEVYRERDVNIYTAGGQAVTNVNVVRGGAGSTMDTTESGAAVLAGSASGTSRGYTEEIEHWAWCIRNRDPANKLRCNEEVGLADAVIALVANKAMRAEERIDFKPEWFDIDSDDTPENIKPDTKRYSS